MRLRRLAFLPLLLGLLAALAPAAPAAVVFQETFAGGGAGWTLDPDWQVGPAVGLPGSLQPWYDPPADRSAGADNRLLGTVIGGSPQNTVHGYWYATSPVIDLSGAPGPKQLSFWRWNTTWYAQPDIDVTVEGWDGSGWVTLWNVQSEFLYFWDQEWTFKSVNLSSFSNADFRVRFGFAVLSVDPFNPTTGVGGLSLDDVTVYTTGDCVDADQDGYFPAACGGPDCDDADPASGPGVGEVCDGLDNDCDGEIDEGVQAAFYPDADGDGYGTWIDPPVMACSAPPGHVDNYQDCDDTHASVYPWAPEACDSLDNDCNGLVDEGVATGYYLDADGDGWGNESSALYSCTPIEGRITTPGDCDDSDPLINVAAAERENGLDDNCNGYADEGFELQRIRFVRDVPNDQGRAVRVRWRKNLREIIPNYQNPSLFANYILYRRVEPGQALAARAKPEGANAQALPPGEWDIVATVLGTNDSTYQVVVPTLCDSNAAGMCRATFFVRARWLNDDDYYIEDSAPDSGYSVDNLAPGAPQSFTASMHPSGNQLSWSAALPPDFQAYRVYRSADPGFTPGPATLVHSTPATGWTDPQPGAFTYKLTVMDANGNESVPAAASATLGVPGGPLAGTLAFAALAPNPFRSAVTVSFDVPRAGTEVEMSVHDLAGRRVRTLARGAQAAGRHAVTWDGRDDEGRPMYAGVYLVRMVGEGRSQTRRVTLVP